MAEQEQISEKEAEELSCLEIRCLIEIGSGRLKFRKASQCEQGDWTAKLLEKKGLAEVYTSEDFYFDCSDVESSCGTLRANLTEKGTEAYKKILEVYQEQTKG